MKQDFTVRLTISELPSGQFYARIDQSPRGASEWPGNLFTLPKGRKQWLESFLQTWQQQASEIQLNPESFGQRLYKLVFDEPIRSRFTAVLDEARQQRTDLRLLLSLCGPSLSRIPFELLHDGKGYLLYSGVRIIRVFDELPASGARRGPFRRLLVALAEPTKDQNGWGLDDYLPKLETVLDKIGGLERVVLAHASRNQVLDALRKAAQEERRPYDAFYVVAHGSASGPDDAQLNLEGADGQSEPVPANLLARALNEHPGCFVFLNACSTAKAPGVNPFAGLAQRLIRDGGCGAVLAMQKPILADRALALADSFFSDLARGVHFEAAAHRAITLQDEERSWVIPCLYGYDLHPDQELQDRLASIFSADPATANFAFYLPGFCMGVPASEYERLVSAGKIVIPAEYHYKGHTYPATDVRAALALMKLAAQLLPRDRIPEAIQAANAEDALQSKASHLVLFGSRSQKIVQDLMKKYSKGFSLEYKDPATGSDAFWRICDLRTGKTYQVPNPAQYKPGSDERVAAHETDYAVVEKIVDEENDRVFFVIAGLQDRGTQGAGEYLAQNWEKLVSRHGAAPFELLLEFTPGLGTLGVRTVLERNSGG